MRAHAREERGVADRRRRRLADLAAVLGVARAVRLAYIVLLADFIGETVGEFDRSVPDRPVRPRELALVRKL